MALAAAFSAHVSYVGSVIEQSCAVRTRPSAIVPRLLHGQAQARADLHDARLNGGLSILDRCGAQHPNTRQSHSGNTSWPVFTSLFWLRTATGTRSELRTPVASLHFFSAQADTVSAPRRY